MSYMYRCKTLLPPLLSCVYTIVMCMTLYAEKCVDCFRALPSLLDSDEEVVTTRYEMSKMQ